MPGVARERTMGSMGTAIHPVGAPARDHHRWALSASTLALALVACQVVQPPAVEVDGPIPPLSKLYVANQTDSGHHVRMNWPDGFIQVAWVEAGTTKGLEGAIGTSGFPATIDVLTADCTLVASLPGLPRGSAGIVVITPLETNLRPLEFADASWSTVGSIEACGATPVG